MANDLQVQISNLLLDPENPRIHDKTYANHGEILQAIIDEQGNKLVNLASDIIEYGTDPSLLPIVIKHENLSDKYIVLEGNRRLVALQLMANPEAMNGLRIPLTIKTSFQELSEQFRLDPIVELSCILFDTRDEAKHWIELRHTGENDGKGTVSWTPTQQERFRVRYGETPPYHIQAIDFLIENSYISSDDTRKIANTNLRRLLEDPDVRNAVGWRVEKKLLIPELDTDEAGRRLMVVVSDLIHGRINVNNIRSKSDRENYIKSLQNELGNSGNRTSSGNVSDSATTTSGSQNVSKQGRNTSASTGLASSSNQSQQKNGGRTRTKSVSRNRKQLIPRSVYLNINQPRINDIYIELRKLNVNDFPNAVGVLFRVFLELSVDHYIREKKIIGYNSDDKLNKKLGAVVGDLEGKSILDKQQLSAARKSSSDEYSFTSINTFNQYVHNRYFPPDAATLKNTWDQLQLFIETMWQ